MIVGPNGTCAQLTFPLDHEELSRMRKKEVSMTIQKEEDKRKRGHAIKKKEDQKRKGKERK